MIAQVKRLVPEATTFVTFVVSTGASLSCGALKSAFATLVRKAEWLVLSIVRYAAFWQLQLCRRGGTFVLPFAVPFRPFVGLRNFGRSVAWLQCWFMVTHCGKRRQVLQHFIGVPQLFNNSIQRFVFPWIAGQVPIV